jgi:hypothetical protein
MITINDLSENLVNNSNSIFITIIIDFINDFIETFNILSKEEILKRINRLEYIGVEKDQYKVFDADATFGSGIYFYIALNSKYQDSPFSTIKSFMYHELIHCLSSHYEDNELKEGLCLGVNNGTLFDEIMTDYYAQLLLFRRKIYNYRRDIITIKPDYQEYIDSYRIGYNIFSSLGKTYDYIFRKDLMEAKFIDSRPFINKFNSLIKELNINSFDYNSFINEKDFHKRLFNISEIFVKYLISSYENNNIDKIEIMYDQKINCFINMLSKEKHQNIVVPNQQLTFYIYNELYKFVYKENKLFIR